MDINESPGTRVDAAGEISARLAAIVDSSDDAIVGKTLDGVITSWNRGAERLFGYSAAEAIGHHIFLIVPEDRRAEEDDVLARLGRGEKVERFETIRRTKDGKLIPISLTVSPVRDAHGVVIGASKVARRS
jgi:PAS domain S-box-containing protein